MPRFPPLYNTDTENSGRKETSKHEVEAREVIIKMEKEQKYHWWLSGSS
jgi:hypothetical protein